MAYSEYKNSGRSLGKCLYQLSTIGIPLHIVESVVMDMDHTLTYYKKPFASFKWTKNDTPVFTFLGEYVRYNQILRQDLHFMFKASKNQGLSFEEIAIFHSKEELSELQTNLSKDYTRTLILNQSGDIVDSNLLVIPNVVTDTTMLVSRLQSKFHSK